MSSDMAGFPSSSKRCVAFLTLSTPQTTNVSVGDHIKFDTALIPPTDNRISIDITSAYSTSLGPSIGRFSLSPGYVYELDFDLVYTNFSSGTTGQVEVGFYDNITASFITSSCFLLPVAQTSTSGGTTSVRALYSPTSNNSLELRIRVATAISQIGFNTPPDVMLPRLIIKTVN